MPPVSSVVSARSSDRQEGPPTLPLGADAAMLAPRAERSSRVSQVTRHTRRTTTSSMAAEILGFSRKISGHMMNMMGQIQDQNQNQINEILAQTEIQRLDAKEREQVLLKMKIETEEANRKREEAQKADALKRDEINLGN